MYMYICIYGGVFWRLAFMYTHACMKIHINARIWHMYECILSLQGLEGEIEVLKGRLFVCVSSHFWIIYDISKIEVLKGRFSVSVKVLKCVLLCLFICLCILTASCRFITLIHIVCTFYTGNTRNKCPKWVYMCKYAHIYMCIYTDVVGYIYMYIWLLQSKCDKKIPKTLRHA